MPLSVPTLLQANFICDILCSISKQDARNHANIAAGTNGFKSIYSLYILMLFILLVNYLF